MPVRGNRLMVCRVGQGRLEKVLKECGVAQEVCPVQSAREQQVKMKELSAI